MALGNVGYIHRRLVVVHPLGRALDCGIDRRRQRSGLGWPPRGTDRCAATPCGTTSGSERVRDLLPGREGHVGATARDDRPFVEATLYRCRAGIPWCDLPERFGAWTKVRTRSRRWAKAGVREGIFRHLAGEADDTSPPARRWWPASGPAAGR